MKTTSTTKPTFLLLLSLITLMSLFLPHPQLPTNLYIIPTTYGGTGNQLYFLLEAIHLARSTNATLLLPPPPPRDNHTAVTHSIDTTRLSNLIRLTPHLPCSKFHHFIHVHRSPTPFKNFSNRVLSTACHFLPSQLPFKQCGQRALASAKLHDLHLPLSHIPNYALLNLLKHLSGCILLDGHSFNRAGEIAQEALHSYLHYIDHIPEIRATAATLAVDVVVHLRFDEHECIRKVHVEGKVCIRIKLPTHGTVVRWVSPKTFVDAVLAEVQRQGLRRMYLAFSPYVPDAMVNTLQGLFAKHLHVLPRVGGSAHVVNLVERQLATDASLFVGDFGSTWSGTVYYKRRTTGKVTVWACRLLRICHDLGYYRFEGLLREPHWFQSLGLL